MLGKIQEERTMLKSQKVFWFVLIVEVTVFPIVYALLADFIMEGMC